MVRVGALAQFGGFARIPPGCLQHQEYCTVSEPRGSIFFSPNAWQMMTFLNPLDALIPQIPFSFFAAYLVRVTSGARGSGPVN